MMKKHYSLACSVLSICMVFSGLNAAYAQQSETPLWVIKDPLVHNVFIENKGQFKLSGDNNNPVLFAFDQGASGIYFTKKGIEYRFRKITGKEADRNVETEENDKPEVQTDKVSMEWQGANDNVQVVAEEQTADYFNYEIKENGVVKSISNIYAYKKIIYKNLYPGIDVEFVFHRGSGIEYSLILHNGADASLFKMNYSNGHTVSIENGDVHVSTLFGDIIDHAPTTFYSNNKAQVITSHFIQEGNSISFQLGNYDHSQPVTIDPWTITPSFPNSNRIWNVQTDGTGNVYLYGGDSPLTLEKFTSAGTPVWTYNTTWDSSSYWLGTLVTDRAGNSYCTSGSNGEVSKVSSGGALVWHNNPNGAFSPTYEYWHEALNCDQTQLIIGGMYGVGTPPSGWRGAMMLINMASGAISSTKVVGNGSGFTIDEVRSICSAPNGNFYFMTLDSIGSVTPALAVNFKNNHTYNFSYGSPSYSIVGNMGLNAMRATQNFVYTQNGSTVNKRSIGSGLTIASAAIPGGSTSGGSPGNGGIDIDSCGNVYVGSTNQVVQYNSNLTKLASTTTPNVVYDVAVNVTGDVIACGNGFAMAIGFGACKPPAPICKPCTNPTITKGRTNPKCNGGTGSATVTPSGGPSPFYYSWSPSSDTTATANNLSAGTYTVSVTNSGGCTVTDTIVISQPAAISIAVSTAPSCSGNNGTATAVVSGGTGPYTYSWSPSGGTSATASNLSAGTYTVTVTDKSGCIQTQTGTVASASGSGPTLTMTDTPAGCSLCNGTATATPSPSGSYKFLWSNSDTTQTINNLCGGTYTVTVDASGGTVTKTFYTENFTTGGTGWTLNTAGPGTNGPNANQWIVDNVSAPCNSGNYLHVECSGSHPPFYTCSTGAHYDPGVPSFDNSATDKYAYSPVVSTVGATNMTLTFTYECNGAAGSDYGIVSLYNGTTWTDLATQYSGVTSCTKASIPIPAAYNGLSNFKYGFRWINAGTGAGSDPPFAIDSISISGTVSAASGCPTVETVIVPSGGSFTVATVPSNASCGSSNGSAVATPTPAGAYTYNWSNGETTQTATGLSAGTYTVIVSAGSGCSDTTKVTVANTGAPTASNATTDLKCNGVNNGSVTVTASGGTSPYTYSWNSGQTTSSVTGLSAGSYTCTVTDKNGCITTDTLTVTQPAVITASTVPTNATCGNNNGSATVTASGGTGTLTYNWTPSGGTNTTASGLSAGTYTCSVTDANGCTQTATATITNSGGPTVVTSKNNPLCNSGTGTATATASGGSSPYTYLWSNGQTTSTVNGLTAGTYTCTVKDKNGCTTIDSAVITLPAAITGSVTGTTAASCGSNNGNATITASGGTGTLTYTWSPSGGTGTTASGLSAGTYTCTVTDANGCTKAIVASVNNTGGPTVTSTQTNLLCNGTNNGSATVTPSGGNPPYTYKWSPAGGTNATASGLSSGSYTCTVTDNSGCVTNDTLTITQPSAISSTNTIINAACGKNNGSISLAVSGGTGSYTYSWAPSGGTNATASNLSAGTYTCTVTDGNSCVKTIILSIANIGAPTVTATESNVLCFGDANGSATVNASGGSSPYTYSWSPAGGTNATANNLSSGTYTCTVTDNSGCVSIDTLTITQPSALTANATTVPATCGKPGSATTTASGGTGVLSYSWSPSGGTNATAANLSSGTYTCTVTDGNGCSTTQTATITGSSGPVVTISHDTTIQQGGTANIIATGGGIYQWSPSTGLSCTNCPNPTATPSKTTDYCVLVSDTSGCQDSACIRVSVELPCGEIFVPNAFSPNGDNENDFECVYGNCIESLDFSIYDRWGNKVFETTDQKQCWDGTYNGTMMNTGVFVYMLQAVTTSGDKITKKGNITLVR